jgi:hypothetical protein
VWDSLIASVYVWALAGMALADGMRPVAWSRSISLTAGGETDYVAEGDWRRENV